MKKINLVLLSLFTAIYSFAASSANPKFAEEETKGKINGKTIYYYKISHLNSKIVSDYMRNNIKIAFNNYKKNGDISDELEVGILEFQLILNDEKFFEYNTKLNKKWAQKFVTDALELANIGEQLSELKYDKKLDTDEGKKVKADYKIKAKKLLLLSRKPVKADKKEYNRQKKLYSAMLKKRAAKARAKTRSKNLKGSSSNKK